MLDWLIVGGGIHGTYLSRVLVEEGGVAHDRVRVLDAEPHPLARWRERTRATGMRFLRSPSVHHLASDPMDLLRFARSWRGGRPFGPPYNMPALDMFDRHAERVIERAGLTRLRLQGRCLGLDRGPRGLVVATDQGELLARRVVLALGSNDGPRIEPWARALAQQGGWVAHVGSAGFQRPGHACARIAVVGAGISGGHVLATLAAERAALAALPMTWITPRPLSVKDLDADAGWVGPKHLRAFAREHSYVRRRQAIRAARNVGTLPAGVARDAQRALASGAASLRLGRVVGGEMLAGGAMRLHLKGAEAEVLDAVDVDAVVLATGYGIDRPGGGWLDSAIERLRLRCAACGYPVVGRGLDWASDLYVSGALAELELGPVSRNIVGARMAGERLAAVARAGGPGELPTPQWPPLPALAADLPASEGVGT